MSSFAPVRELPQLHLQVQQTINTPTTTKRPGLKPLHLSLTSTSKTNASPITSPIPETLASPLMSPAVPLSRANSCKSDNRLRSPKSSRPATNRRLSSISYSPSPREGHSYSSPSPSRSNSVWAIPATSLVNEDGPEPNVGSTNPTPTSNPTGVPDQENARPITELTLIEKHADLLHFIAQKESKCLELRSQLEVQESELKALKAKWERIVSKANRPSSGGGSSRPHSMHAKSGSSIAPLANSDVVVEAIKDLGRYLGGYKIDDKASTRSHTAEDSVANASYTPNTEIPNVQRTASKRLSMISNSSSVSSTGTAVSSPPAQSSFQLNTTARTAANHRRSNADHIASKVEAVPKELAADDTGPVPEDAETKDGEDADRTGERLDHSSSKVTLSASTVLGSASDWMMNKKWDTIQSSNALAKSSKRASLLLADVTDISASWLGSISSVLSPPPTATGSDLPHSDSTVASRRAKNPVNSDDKSHGTENLTLGQKTIDMDPSEKVIRKPASSFAAKSAASREKRSPLAQAASLKTHPVRNVPRRASPATTGSDDEWIDW